MGSANNLQITLRKHNRLNMIKVYLLVGCFSINILVMLLTSRIPAGTQREPRNLFHPLAGERLPPMYFSHFLPDYSQPTLKRCYI